MYWWEHPKTTLVIKLLRPTARVPEYKSAKASGFDLHACLDHPMVIRPREWEKVPTGIALRLPPSFEGQVRPRSGIAASQGVTVLNAPGTVDEDYIGEIIVVLINHGDTDFVINDGERIAQLVIAPVLQMNIQITSDDLPPTDRGDGGFGSTGR